MDMNKKNHDRILDFAISLLNSPDQSARHEDISELLNELCLIFPSNKALLDDSSQANGNRDCFDFLKRISPPKICELFQKEDPGKIALISFFFTRNEMAKLISFLSPAQRIEVLLQMEKTSKVAFHAVKHTSSSFASQLKSKSIQLIEKNNPQSSATPPPFQKYGNTPKAIPALFRTPNKIVNATQDGMADFEAVQILS